MGGAGPVRVVDERGHRGGLAAPPVAPVTSTRPLLQHRECSRSEGEGPTRRGAGSRAESDARRGEPLRPCGRRSRGGAPTPDLEAEVDFALLRQGFPLLRRESPGSVASIQTASTRAPRPRGALRRCGSSAGAIRTEAGRTPSRREGGAEARGAWGGRRSSSRGRSREKAEED